jgi:hypothetical protein
MALTCMVINIWMFSVQMLMMKSKKAVHGLHLTTENFNELSSTISQDTRVRWLQQETEALEKEDGFQIFNIDITKG